MADNPKAKDLITSDDTPILTGTYDSSDSNGFLTVTVGGSTYSLGTDAELTTSKDTWTLDLSSASPLAEGPNSIDVAAQDATGSPLSTGFTSTVTLDTSTPTPFNLVVNGDNSGIEGDGFLTEYDIASAFLTAEAEAFSTIQADLQLLALAGPGYTPFASTTVDANGNWDFVLSELGELPPIPGGLELEAQMRFTPTDSAGNVGEGIVLDAVFDTVVSSVNFTPQPVTVNNQNSSSNAPLITGSYGYDGSTIFGATALEVTVAGTTYTLGKDAALTTSGTTWSLDLSQTAQTLDAGRYDVKATHADTAGNRGSDSTSGELLITNAPGIPVNPTVNHLETSNFKPTLKGLYDPSSTTLSVEVDGNTYNLGSDTELSVNGKNWALDLSAAGISEGVHNVIVTDDNGSDTTSDEVTIDRPLFDPSIKSQTTTDGDTNITGWFHSAQSDIFSVTVNGSTYTLGTDAELTNGGNQWTLDLASTLSAGNYEVVATSADVLGNTASDSSTSEITIQEIAGADETITANFRPKITGEFDADATNILTVAVGGTTYTLGTDAELTDVGGNQWVLDLANAPIDRGFHDVVVTANDTDTNTVTTDTSVDEVGIFNIVGSVVSDTLTGNLGSKNGIISNGGYDTITGGNLDDAIAVTDNNFLSVDGGKGLDTLILAGDDMSLSSIDFTKLFSIEAMDLSGGGASNNTITLRTQDVLDMSSSDELTITGEATDTVFLDNWGASTGTQDIGGVMFDSYAANGASLLIEQGIDASFS